MQEQNTTEKKEKKVKNTGEQTYFTAVTSLKAVTLKEVNP